MERLATKPEFKFVWRYPPPLTLAPESFTFRCPECFFEFKPANVQCITCGNCGHGGSKQNFSAIVRKAA